MVDKERFNPQCRRCSRLARWLDRVQADYPSYHARPVPSFGDRRPRLLIVGLAPGLHGANATGRPFTGDYAGILLYQTLYEAGLANQPEAHHRRDGLRLKGCRITNAVKCLPPGNKPTGAEINNCNSYLKNELEALSNGSVILALGKIAHDAVLKAAEQRLNAHPFVHAAVHDLGQWHLVDSYHCSRYNTQTGRLTPAMFQRVVAQAQHLAARTNPVAGRRGAV